MIRLLFGKSTLARNESLVMKGQLKERRDLNHVYFFYVHRTDLMPAQVRADVYTGRVLAL